ncbi:MAG TPA: alpha/beta hydrolase [Puia sp.]
MPLAEKTIQTLLLFSILLPTVLLAQDTVNLSQPGSRPFLTIYRPADTKQTSHTAVIICSGGSYGRTADEEEGIPAAKFLAANGITAFLLDYRIPQGKDSLPLADAQEAIRYVRLHAKEYHFSPAKVGIMGFSAGGHLVSTIGTHWKNNYDTIQSTISTRPDFMVLVYPVISFADSLTHLRSRSNFLGNEITPERIKEFSNELQVTEDTPPAFIVAAVDDGVVKVENSLYFEAALRQHHVPVEIFLYQKGGHGFGIDNKTASVQWTDACIQWIRKQ